MKSNVDKAWFVSQIRKGGWKSQREFAPIIGMDHSALSRILNGERHVKSDEVSTIAKKFGTSTDEVHAHLGTSNNTVGVETATPVAKRGDQKYGKVGGGSATAKPSERRHPGFGFMEAQVDFKHKLNTDSQNTDSQNEVRIVPPLGADPLFGCMAGTLTLLPDVDYTAPADPDWGKVYDDD